MIMLHPLFRSRRWLSSAACAALAGVIVAAGMWLGWIGPSRESPLDRVVVAAGDTARSIEGRLTGGFEYQSTGRRTRGAGTEPASASLLLAVAQLDQEILRAPSPEKTHAWGVAQLLLRRYDAAIAGLERAAGQAAENARIRSDLAVAYLERARGEERSEDWPRAMASAERASVLDPSLSEAVFNRAVSAEAMGLRHEAIRLWEAYLALDSPGEWRQEADHRMAALRSAVKSPRSVADRLWRAAESGDEKTLAAIAASDPQLAREFVDDQLLPDWGAAARAQRGQRATQSLAAARVIAGVTGRYDRALTDAVDGALRHDTGAVAARERLAEAYVRFGNARRQYEANAVADAARTFADAERLFGDATHPFALWSRLHVAIAAYYRGEYAAVRATMATLEASARKRSYMIVAARAAWMQGLAANLESDFQAALHHFEQAEAIFARAGEPYNRAAVQNILGNIYLYVGRQQDVWRLSLAALDGSRDDPSYRRRHTQLMTAAHQALRSGLAETALVFQDEALRLDNEWGEPAALSELHGYRARTLAELGRRREAEEALALARARVEAVGDALLRRRLEAEHLQTEVDVLVQTDPKRGIEAAGHAISYFADTKSSLRLPRLYLARGRAWQTVGAHERAIGDLTAAAERFESERKTLPRSQELRLSHVDELWSVYPALVDAAQRNGAACQSLLAAADRGRAFNLREARRQPAAATSALPVLAADEVILHYTFLADRLLILTLYQGGCDVHIVGITAAQVERTGQAWIRTLSEGNDRAAGRELFEQILAPAWPRVSAARHLGVVADGPIHSLPLSALPTGGERRLINQVDVRLLPTLALRGSTRRPSRPIAGRRSVALIATGGESAAESLPRLPFAQSEGAAVRRLLADAGVRVLPDSHVPLREQLSSVHIFHFAGHALVNPTFPLLSRLMLSGRDEPWVTSHDIADTQLSDLQLVVLSACETERGERFGGEGPASLARAFLSAGALEVIATLWPVQDQSTSALVTTFYQQWLRHGDAPAALREAALSNMADDNQEWAAWLAVTPF